MTGIPAKMYLGGVVAKTHFVAFVATIVPLGLRLVMNEGIIRLLIVGAVSIISSLITIYTLGLDKSEKKFMQNKFNDLVFSKFHK